MNLFGANIYAIHALRFGKLKLQAHIATSVQKQSKETQLTVGLRKLKLRN